MSPQQFTDEHIIDLYKHQNELFWKHFTPVAVFESAILVAWYALYKDEQSILSGLVAGAGTLIMLAQLALVARSNQYLKVYHDRLMQLSDLSIPAAWGGFSGGKIALSIPLILASVNSVVMIASLSFGNGASAPTGIPAKDPVVSVRMEPPPRAVRATTSPSNGRSSPKWSPPRP